METDLTIRYLGDLPPPPMGHNRPPGGPPTPTELANYLADTHTALLGRRDDLAQNVAAFVAALPTVDRDGEPVTVIHTEDQAAAALQNLNLLEAHLALAEKQRVIAKAPYLEACKALDGWFAAVKATVTRVHGTLGPAVVAYGKAKRNKAAAAAAEAARERQEAADRAIAAARAAAEAQRPAAEELFDAAIRAQRAAEKAQEAAVPTLSTHGKITGTYGATGTVKEEWTVEVQHVDRLPPEFVVKTANMAALNKAVKAGARHIDGCRIYPVDKLRMRG